jgi:hypothetical protein
MAIRIPTGAIQNLQQIEAAVAGPDGANRIPSKAARQRCGTFSFRKNPQASEQSN